MQSATSSANARRSKRRPRDLAQFDLFAALSVPSISGAVTEGAILEALPGPAMHFLTQPDPVRPNAAQLREDVVDSSAKPTSHQSRRKPVAIRIIVESDLPDYSNDERAFVDRSLDALPQTKTWFTYADIAAAFAISRSTVVRRARAGLIPGIRFAGSRVLEDGTVRRFTRDQVRYVLLAVRAGR